MAIALTAPTLSDIEAHIQWALEAGRQFQAELLDVGIGASGEDGASMRVETIVTSPTDIRTLVRHVRLMTDEELHAAKSRGPVGEDGERLLSLVEHEIERRASQRGEVRASAIAVSAEMMVAAGQGLQRMPSQAARSLRRRLVLATRFGVTGLALGSVSVAHTLPRILREEMPWGERARLLLLAPMIAALIGYGFGFLWALFTGREVGEVGDPEPGFKPLGLRKPSRSSEGAQS